MDPNELLTRTARLAAEFLAGVDERPVGRPIDLGGPAAGDGRRQWRQDARDGQDPAAVVEDLARTADPGLVASPGPATSAS